MEMKSIVQAGSDLEKAENVGLFYSVCPVCFTHLTAIRRGDEHWCACNGGHWLYGYKGWEWLPDIEVTDTSGVLKDATDIQQIIG